MAYPSASGNPTPSALCPGNPEMAALFEAALNLVEQVPRLATSSFLGLAEHPRGVVHFSRELTPEGFLQLFKGMNHEVLPYVSGLSSRERVLFLESRLQEEGPLLPGFGQELYGSRPGPRRPTTAPDAGRDRSSASHASGGVLSWTDGPDATRVDGSGAPASGRLTLGG